MATQGILQNEIILRHRKQDFIPLINLCSNKYDHDSHVFIIQRRRYSDVLSRNA